MKRAWNWQLWVGLALAVVAFLSYFLFFARFAMTRDIPWASLVLFLIAGVLLISGWRRAPRKLLPSLVALVGLLIIGAFTFTVTIGTRNLPASARAPSVGQKAPQFALPDTNNRTVSLSGLLAESNGVLLVFYRGFW
jgi:MFS superfamily sulfate permease-like transporter